MGVDSFADEGEDVSGLLAAGLDDRQDCFREPASRCTLGPDRQFSPDHRVTQGPLSGIVGRFHPLDIQKLPEPLPLSVQPVAHPIKPGVSLETAAHQGQNDWHLCAIS